MQKSEKIAFIIPVLFIIVFIGVRIMQASEITKIALNLFIIGMTIGQWIGAWWYKSLLQEVVIDTSGRYLRMRKVLLSAIMVIAVWLIIEIFII